MKIIILESCIINLGNDRGGQHAERLDMPDVPKDTAVKLVGYGRALYINKSDDPDKAGVNTAPQDLVDAAKAAAAEKAKAAKS